VTKTKKYTIYKKKKLKQTNASASKFGRSPRSMKAVLVLQLQTIICDRQTDRQTDGRQADGPSERVSAAYVKLSVTKKSQTFDVL